MWQLGILWKKGETSRAGAYGFDDCALVSRNNEPLNIEDKKNLFLVRGGSGYGARYCAAAFMPLVAKIFACNFDWTDEIHEPSSMASEYRWLKVAANGDAAGMTALHLNVHEKAIARKVIVFGIKDDEFLFTDAQQAKFKRTSSDINAERNERYASFLHKLSEA